MICYYRNVCVLGPWPIQPELFPGYPVASFRENIHLNFEFKNEATRANLQVNKRILKWRPFWNKVYSQIHFDKLVLCRN